MTCHQNLRTKYVMERQMLYLHFLFTIWFLPVLSSVSYTLGSSCNLSRRSECPGFPNSECNSHGKCDCRQPDFYAAYSVARDFKSCQLTTTLRAGNLRLNGPASETELSLEWDRPINVHDPLTYRIVVDGIEEITPINATTYTLTNRQPGTTYRIQIYTSTWTDFGIAEQRIENDNPLQGTFHTDNQRQHPKRRGTTRAKVLSVMLRHESRRSASIKYEQLHNNQVVSSTRAIVCSVAGSLCFIVIVVICSRTASSRVQRSNGLELSSMTNVQHSEAELAEIQGPCVRLCQFTQYVVQMNKQSNDPLRREFKKFKESISPELTTKIGSLKVNKVKNRYFNAIPYDHTRVKLLAFGDGFNDYINASYIAGPRSSCDYIAAQGPMFSTTPDFWRMVCEHRSGIIVMLSDFSEDGQRKLDKYWPDQLMTPVLYGEVLVEVTSCSITTTTTIRKMTVSMTGRNKLTLTHIFIPGWKNYAYTLGLDELYDVIGSVRKLAPSNEGPITVHCSSGIGRTGMFISLDILMRIVVKTDLSATVNVNSIVKTILECRPEIIQSEDQYIFIHTALSAFIEKKKQILIQSTSDPKSLPSNKDESHVYASLDETAQIKQRDTHF